MMKFQSLRKTLEIISSQTFLDTHQKTEAQRICNLPKVTQSPAELRQALVSVGRLESAAAP